MSFIDIYRHELCGTLAGVPLYRPVEHISGEFDATTDDLVLGGGSGELAGSVIDVPAAIATTFDAYIEDASCLLCRTSSQNYCAGCHWSRLDQRKPLGRALVDAARDCGITDRDIIDELSYVGEALVDQDIDRLMRPADWADWGGDTWHRIVTAASQPHPLGPSYAPETHRSIEHWLTLSVGEYAMVSLRPEHLFEPLKQQTPQAAFYETVRQHASVLPLFANVAQHPTGYATGGRGDQLGVANMRH